MTKFVTLFFFAGLFSLNSSAQLPTDGKGSSLALGGYSGGGGHDDKVANFYQAKAILQEDLARLVERNQKLSELPHETFSAEEKEILNRYLHVIFDESKSIEFKFDHITSETFQNADRSHSWIQTDPEPFGEIRVRTLPMGAKKSVDSLRSRLLHECIHHIPEIGLNEEKAWPVGAVFLKAFAVLKQTYSFPELVDWPRWMVSVVGQGGKKEECGAYIQVLANPESGTISVTSARNAKGSQGQSGFVPGLLQLVSLGLLDLICNDSTKFSIVFHCERDSNGIYCKPRYCNSKVDPKCSNPDPSSYSNRPWLRVFPEVRGLTLSTSQGIEANYLPLDVFNLKNEETKIPKLAPRQ